MNPETELVKKQLKRIHARLVARWRLTSSSFQSALERQEPNSAAVTLGSFRSTIGQYIPLLAHYIETDHIPLQQIYRDLVALAGGLSTLYREPDVNEFPVYRSDKWEQSFTEVFKVLIRLTRSSMAPGRPRSSIQLEFRDDGLFYATLLDPHNTAAEEIVIAVKSDQAKEHIVSEFPKIARTACWRDITKIVGTQTVGATLSGLEQLPEELKPRPDTVYFGIVPSDPYWQQMVSEQNMAIYVSPLECQVISIEVTVFFPDLP